MHLALLLDIISFPYLSAMYIMKYLFYLTFALSLFLGFSTQPNIANNSSSYQNILKAESKSLSSDSTLWVDDENIDSELISEESELDKSSKPFTIIGLIIFSLVLVVGVMFWSILTVNSKKKAPTQKPQTISKKSNFKLIDSFGIDNGKTLYLVQLFDKKYVLGSTWGSICFISEYNGEISPEILETKEAKAPESCAKEKETEQPIGNLDFLTTEDNEVFPLEEGFKSLIKNVADEFSKKPEPISKQDNLYDKLESSPQTKSTGRKLSSILKDEKRKPATQTETITTSGQIKRSYTPDNSPKVLDTYTSVRKPSWLKERENKRTLVESIFSKNKIQNQTTAKEYLESIENKNTTQQQSPQEISEEILDLTDNQPEQNKIEEQVNNETQVKQKTSLINPIPTDKPRKKISIVED